MPDPELFTLKGLAVESCLGSGTAGLYRPGNSPTPGLNETANFHWLLRWEAVRRFGSGCWGAGTLPSASWKWGCCPLAAAGSLLSSLLSHWPSAHPGSLGQLNWALYSDWLLGEPVSFSFSGISYGEMR